MKFKTALLSGVLAAAWAGSAVSASRDYISIVGSSTVYPFATVVAETFGKSTSFKTPKIESTGSGGGMKLFCAGVGLEHPDITNSSRRIKASEVKQCHENGVNEIVEVKVGYDGIALASSKEAAPMELTRKDIFLALAKDIPDPKAPDSGKLVANPNQTWKDVNSKLPAIKIRVLGPPPTSGTRDAFAELAMEGGCKKVDWIAAMKKTDKKAYKSLCHTVREDGAYVEAGENDNLIVQKLVANKDSLGVFGYSYLEENSDKIQGNSVDGVMPEFELIASGQYPVSRPLYFYVKAAHVGTVPGMKEFLAEFTSEKAFGAEGYLADKGLIPMQDDERKQFAADAAALKNLEM
jgi:phosphate transport system substrate-binding protein